MVTPPALRIRYAANSRLLARLDHGFTRIRFETVIVTVREVVERYRLSLAFVADSVQLPILIPVIIPCEETEQTKGELDLKISAPVPDPP